MTVEGVFGGGQVADSQGAFACGVSGDGLLEFRRVFVGDGGQKDDRIAAFGLAKAIAQFVDQDEFVVLEGVGHRGADNAERGNQKGSDQDHKNDDDHRVVEDVQQEKPKLLKGSFGFEDLWWVGFGLDHGEEKRFSSLKALGIIYKWFCF